MPSSSRTRPMAAGSGAVAVRSAVADRQQEASRPRPASSQTKPPASGGRVPSAGPRRSRPASSRPPSAPISSGPGLANYAGVCSPVPRLGASSRSGSCRPRADSLQKNSGGPRRISSGRPSSAGRRRAQSEAAAPRVQASFLLSPQRRLEDAESVLQLCSEEERRALKKELQCWYFGCDGVDFDRMPEADSKKDEGKAHIPSSSPGRPAVGLLEEAAASRGTRSGSSPLTSSSTPCGVVRPRSRCGLPRSPAS